MRLVLGARMRGLRVETLFAICVASEVYQRHGFEMDITSGVEGKHSRGSLHYAGAAVDLRIKNIPTEVVLTIVDDIKERLDTDYDVVLEGNHIHIEFQPKGE
jgi:hypothetical protein